MLYSVTPSLPRDHISSAWTCGRRYKCMDMWAELITVQPIHWSNSRQRRRQRSSLSQKSFPARFNSQHHSFKCFRFLSRYPWKIFHFGEKKKWLPVHFAFNLYRDYAAFHWYWKVRINEFPVGNDNRNIPLKSEFPIWKFGAASPIPGSKSKILKAAVITMFISTAVLLVSH